MTEIGLRKHRYRLPLKKNSFSRIIQAMYQSQNEKYKSDFDE